MGIDVERLEKELSALWADMGKAQREGVHKSVTRACVLNLVAFVSPRDDRAELDAMLDEVMQRNPGRALVLLADAGAGEAGLDASVSSRCRETTRGARQICGEQVTFEARGAVGERLASAVAPMLVPDVPVFLWWKDIPHDDDKLFARLASMSDRIVIDSAACDHPHLDFQRLSKMLADATQTVIVSDINWGRLTSWRTLLASFWDVEAYRAHLDAISRVRIVYDPLDAEPDDISPQAWLMLGWLASRLGWELDASSARVEQETLWLTLLTKEGRAVAVELRAVEDAPARDGNLAALTFLAEETGAQFHVEYRPERTKLETSAHIGGESIVGRVLAYEARSEGMRLSGELSLLARDATYERAVSAAARMIDALPDESRK